MFRNLFLSLLVSIVCGTAAAAGVGDSASFTINSKAVTGKVTAVAADGTLTVTNGNAVFTLAPKGEIVVTTTGSGAAAATGAYTASMNAAAMQMVGLGGVGATGLALGGLSATTVTVVAVTVAAVAAISDGTTNTTTTTSP